MHTSPLQTLSNILPLYVVHLLCTLLLCKHCPTYCHSLLYIWYAHLSFANTVQHIATLCCTSGMHTSPLKTLSNILPLTVVHLVCTPLLCKHCPTYCHSMLYICYAHLSFANTVQHIATLCCTSLMHTSPLQTLSNILPLSVVHLVCTPLLCKHCPTYCHSLLYIWYAHLSFANTVQHIATLCCTSGMHTSPLQTLSNILPLYVVHL